MAIIWDRDKVNMFPNLEIEQDRHGHSDAYVAEKLAITQQEYRSGKESGTFTASKADMLLTMYNKPFEYLFKQGDTND